MGYRGEDLDLRTPQTWSATPADLAGASDAGRHQERPARSVRALVRFGSMILCSRAPITRSMLRLPIARAKSALNISCTL